MKIMLALTLIILGLNLPAQEVGRFQIVTTQHQSEPMTLKIDTITGKTWQLLTVSVETKPRGTVTGWVEITDTPFEDAERISNNSKPKAKVPGDLDWLKPQY